LGDDPAGPGVQAQGEGHRGRAAVGLPLTGRRPRLSEAAGRQVRDEGRSAEGAHKVLDRLGQGEERRRSRSATWSTSTSRFIRPRR
jgi:hypothetical protein